RRAARRATWPADGAPAARAQRRALARHPSQRLPARRRRIPRHTRETIIRGLAGVITFTPATITVTLEPPGQPRVARALALLIDEINAQPPSIPGDSRPIPYHITPKPGI